MDDFSDLESHPDLGERLEQWVSQREMVRLVRNEERQGLIRSKNAGAEQSEGEVVVFLDAHCEVNVNWLPPLLAPIAENVKTVSVPIIDVLGLSALPSHCNSRELRMRFLEDEQFDNFSPQTTPPLPTAQSTLSRRSLLVSGSGDFSTKRSSW